MKLSIVTTLYKSAPYIEEFVRRVCAEAEKITDDYEIVMVDDGSPDKSLEIALNIQESNTRLSIIELSRNFGHHKAMMTGMDHANGDLIFLIDIDLEEPPELLGRFYKEMQDETLDVTYGYQEERKGGVFERYVGKLAWVLINKLYSIQIPRNLCTVRLMRRAYVRSLLLHKEGNTVIGGLWVITGYNQLGISIKKGSRGLTSYTVFSRFGVLLNGITSFSTVPLIFMVVFGMLVSLTAFVFGLFVIIDKIIRNTIAGWASLIVSVWFLGGVIIFCMGILGIYIAKIFIETKHRPYTIVKKIHSGEKHEQ